MSDDAPPCDATPVVVSAVGNGSSGVKQLVPAALQPVIERCLGLAGGARFVDAAALVAALKWVESSPSTHPEDASEATTLPNAATGAVDVRPNGLTGDQPAEKRS